MLQSNVVTLGSACVLMPARHIVHTHGMLSLQSVAAVKAHDQS